MNIRTWIEPARDKYRVRFRDAKGKKRDIWPVSLFDKRSQALGAKDEWRRTQLGKAVGSVDLATPLSKLFERWLVDCAAGLANKKGKVIKASTIQAFRDSFKYVLGSISTLKELDNEWTKDYKRYLSVRYAPWTVHRRLVDLKSFCSYLRRQKVMNWDPFEEISISKPEGKPRFYTDEEIAGFESGAASLNSPYSLLYVRLGYMCGLRHSEAFNLELEDVRPSGNRDGWGLITIWETEAKTRRSRTIPTPPEVTELIVALADKRKQGRIFAQVTEQTMHYWWARILAASGLKPAPVWIRKKYRWALKEGLQDRGESPYHGLRHTYCRRQIENGMDLTELQKITGHKSVDVLMKTYAHFAQAHLMDRAKEVHARLSSRAPFVGQMWGKITQIVENNGNDGQPGETDSAVGEK